MNTTEKGDKLESKVYDLFSEAIGNGNFLAAKENCEIFSKKGYYSRDRKKEIVFDIAIEISMPGANSPAIIYIIECKNYNHSVPVDDVEELFTKVQQISGANVKAVVVARNSYQSGAFEFSKSKGIGLARYYERNTLEWVLNRSPSSLLSRLHAVENTGGAYSALHSEIFESDCFDLYGYVDGNYTNSLNLFLSDLALQGLDDERAQEFSFLSISNQTQTPQVKFVEESEIESFCEFLRKNTEYSGGAVSLSAISQYLRLKDGLVVNLDVDLDKGILGVVNLKSKVISISKNHETDERRRFTLAHEIGHHVLGHADYMEMEKCTGTRLDIENPVQIGIEDIKRMESQANLFASCLLLPRKEIVRSFASAINNIGLKNKGFGVLFVDKQPCNLQNYHGVTSRLKYEYQVSKEAVSIRLHQLGFIRYG